MNRSPRKGKLRYCPPEMRITPTGAGAATLVSPPHPLVGDYVTLFFQSSYAQTKMYGDDRRHSMSPSDKHYKAQFKSALKHLILSNTFWSHLKAIKTCPSANLCLHGQAFQFFSTIIGIRL